MDFPIAVSSPLVVCILRTTSSISKLLGRRTDDEVGPFCDDVELVVGDDRGDLDDDVVRWVQSGHLEVHPGEHRWASYPDPGQLNYGALSCSRFHWFASTWPFRRRATARLGDAGCDLVARPVRFSPRRWSRDHRDRDRLEIPDGYAGLVLPRSGLAAQHGVTCLNAPGLIDPGYRGEVAVILVNTDPNSPYEVYRGDRIAQLVVCRVEKALFVAVESLETSERGKGGFGHSGR